MKSLVLIGFGLLGLVLSAGCEQQSKNTTAPPQATSSTSETTSTPDTSTAGAESRPAATETLVDKPFVARLKPSDLRVFDYNINSVYPQDMPLEEKPVMSEKFARLLKATKPDIISLQEIPGEMSNEMIVTLLNTVLPQPEGATWYVYKGEGGFMDNVIAARFPLSQTGYKTVPTADEQRQRRLAFALVDLPDETFSTDAYIFSVHFKSRSGAENEATRQREVDAIMGWIHDAKTPGDHVDIPKGTAILITGDMNTVGGPGILETATLGNISDEERFGPDFLPDWDDTDFVDSKPLHNAVGPDFYTWRDDGSQYPPGRLDYIIFSDSVLKSVKKYILNTTTMSDELLTANGLERLDVTEDEVGSRFDHLPLVVDFRPIEN